MIDTNRSIGKQINETARDVRKVLHHHLGEYSLGDGQFAILYEIFNNSKISQDQLSKNRRVDKATIAKAIKKLMDNGYVYRERDEKDKRAYCLYCTQKGIDFIPEIERIIKLEMEVTTKGISVEELELLSSLLRRVRGNIEEYLKGEDNE